MNKIKQFLDECKEELNKVVWPDKNERIGATWVVIIAVTILTTIIYLLDLIYFKGINKIF